MDISGLKQQQLQVLLQLRSGFGMWRTRLENYLTTTSLASPRLPMQIMEALKQAEQTILQGEPEVAR
eukprot:4210874-Prorocentrum_lima.AAC.1